MDGAVIRGRAVAVERHGDAVTVTVDGVRHEASADRPLEVPW